jgi:hypothetical protein
MFCDPLDFQQFTTVIKSLNSDGTDDSSSPHPPNDGQISSTFRTTSAGSAASCRCRSNWSAGQPGAAAPLLPWLHNYLM